MKLLEHLAARGLVKDTTDRHALDELLAGAPILFYCGFDPSGPSLHAGSLVPLALMTWLARAGHQPLAVLGGATGMVGDPSGKSSERTLLAADELARNAAAVGAQLARLLPGAEVVDNASWTQMRLLEFLRDVGKHVSVNSMLAKESVRARLEDREQGISYTEFSYMLLQAWDFAHLARARDCRLQVGGSDQWGNITCGIDLARRMGTRAQLHALVTPLLMTASGEKFGKSEAGTSVWLDPAMTSPYAFYQYWLGAADADVERFLLLFTFISLHEIAEVVAAHDADRAARSGQRRLAREVTSWVHGADAARAAGVAAQVLFGGSVDRLTDADLAGLDVPRSEFPRAELAAGIPILDLLVRTGLADSRSAARRLITQGGAYVNNLKVDDPARSLGLADLATESVLLLRAGKKSFHLVQVI